jgi:hypothetical protein
MSVIKQKAQGVNPSIEARDLKLFAGATGGNVYESIAILSNRANQISQTLKQELHGKLNEFASSVDNLEEVLENKEQIEISKFYERLPNPSILATMEFMEQKLDWRFRGEEDQPTVEPTAE